MTASGNLFHDVPTRLTEEQVDELANAPGVRIERIVSTGQCSPDGFWYDQEESEWVVLLAGQAVLEFDGDRDPVEMSPGDWLLIAAHERHRVASTAADQPTVWLAVFYRD